jgi:hypothetical protein
MLARIREKGRWWYGGRQQAAWMGSGKEEKTAAGYYIFVHAACLLGDGDRKTGWLTFAWGGGERKRDQCVAEHKERTFSNKERKIC